MNNSELLFKQACDIIRMNDSISNAKEAWEIVRALKLLVEANKQEKKHSPLKVKIIMAMASCNYQIGNWTLAYNCALIAKKEIDKVASDGPFDSNSTRRLLREEDCDEIIEAIKKGNPKSITELMENYVLSTVDTTYLRNVFPLKNDAPFSKEAILKLIEILNNIISMYYKKAEIDGNWSIAESSAQYVNIFKYPLLYIWQKYKYGKDEEVWKEGEDMMLYQMFISQIDKHIPELLSLLKTSTPFAGIERDGKITETLILILSDLQKRINMGLE